MKTSAKETGILTVAAIRRPERGETRVLFNERQRIFALSSKIKPEKTYQLLEQSLRKKTPIKAVLDLRRPLIERISAASPAEIEEFERLRIPLEEPDKVRAIDVASIDPTTFNIVEHYLDWRTFRLCRRIIPMKSAWLNLSFFYGFVPQRVAAGTPAPRIISRH